MERSERSMRSCADPELFSCYPDNLPEKKTDSKKIRFFKGQMSLRHPSLPVTMILRVTALLSNRLQPTSDIFLKDVFIGLEILDKTGQIGPYKDEKNNLADRIQVENMSEIRGLKNVRLNSVICISAQVVTEQQENEKSVSPARGRKIEDKAQPQHFVVAGNRSSR